MVGSRSSLRKSTLEISGRIRIRHWVSVQVIFEENSCILDLRKKTLRRREKGISSQPAIIKPFLR